MSFGLNYMGSKNRIAPELIRKLPVGKRLVDLFGGGFAVAHCAALAGKWRTVLYNDVNPLVVQLVKDALAGKYDEGVFKPEFISRERFFAEKDTCGYVKWGWSFGGNGERIQLAMKRKTKPALWLSALPRRNPNRPRNGKSQARESYRTRRDRFLAKLRNKLCPVALAVWKRKVPVAEVHHTRGRIGTLLNDERYWLAVSRIGHRWIHEHPQAARERGWLAERGSWGTAE